MSVPEAVRVNGLEADVVSVLERALHYGDGLFETIACVGGRLRFPELHLERLALGCARLGIAAPASEVLQRELTELASGRCILKLLVSRGVAGARGYAVTGRETATRITLRYPWPADDPQTQQAGVCVRSARQTLGENPQLAGLKHCNRLEQVLALRESSDPRLKEALMFSSSGALISGAMSNVFLVLDGTLVTPRLSRCGVAGVMRRVVLGLAAQAGIASAEGDLGAQDLARAPELFLTSALTGIRPVRELDGRTLAPGPVTRALQERLAPLLAGPAGG